MTHQSITGHSMGGHGALTLALSNPGHFESVSAFAPICNPTKSDWGRKQFEAYLGDDHAAWEKYDATVLMGANGTKCPVLIDTGTDDQFYDLLGTSAFASAVADQKVEASIRLQKGYDHSYFFYIHIYARTYRISCERTRSKIRHYDLVLIIFTSMRRRY